MELVRDRRADFDEVGVQPVGISRDSPWYHIAWTQVLDLNFGLLSDFNGEAVRAFGIGFEYRGLRDVAQRSAFLVDETGVVRAPGATPSGDVPDVDELARGRRGTCNCPAHLARSRPWTHLYRLGRRRARLGRNLTLRADPRRRRRHRAHLRVLGSAYDAEQLVRLLQVRSTSPSPSSGSAAALVLTIWASGRSGKRDPRGHRDRRAAGRVPGEKIFAPAGLSSS